MAICLPCVVIPFFLFIWRFIQPWILMFWNTEKKLPQAGMEQKKANENTDTNNSTSCPLKATSEVEKEEKKEL